MQRSVSNVDSETAALSYVDLRSCDRQRSVASTDPAESWLRGMTALLVLVQALADALNGPVIVAKGRHDTIARPGGHPVLASGMGSPRRCGGQGDVLSGILGATTSWAVAHATTQVCIALPSTRAYIFCCTFSADFSLVDCAAEKSVRNCLVLSWL